VNKVNVDEIVRGYLADEDENADRIFLNNVICFHENDGDINTKSFNGQTLLHYACDNGCLDLIEWM